LVVRRQGRVNKKKEKKGKEWGEKEGREMSILRKEKKKERKEGRTEGGRKGLKGCWFTLWVASVVPCEQGVGQGDRTQVQGDRTQVQASARCCLHSVSMMATSVSAVRYQIFLLHIHIAPHTHRPQGKGEKSDKGKNRVFFPSSHVA
jgi:hypothetical protein